VHTLLHVDQHRAKSWSELEIVERWSRVFGVPTIVRRWKEGVAGEAEAMAAVQLIAQWRSRLMDVSWFMRCLNEYLARRANAEDWCTGRFWEGRFKSQALLDEAGMLTAMAYVDLGANFRCRTCIPALSAVVIAGPNDTSGTFASTGSKTSVPTQR